MTPELPPHDLPLRGAVEAFLLGRELAQYRVLGVGVRGERVAGAVDRADQFRVQLEHPAAG